MREMDATTDSATAGEVSLRDVRGADLPILFEQQRDPLAVEMAAFTSRDPDDLDAFMRHWRYVLPDPSIMKQTILLRDEVAGYIVSYFMDGQREVGYWLGRQYWGMGVASQALAAFLRQERRRPLHARAARDNYASIRVLQKSGFVVVGQERGYANARRAMIDEVVLLLRA